MINSKMKAYLVSGYDIEDEEKRLALVFATSAGQAKSIAHNTADFWYIPYIELRATREPLMDNYYEEGKNFLAWYDLKDRQILVKKLGWQCSEPDEFECQVCSAKMSCNFYLDKQKEYEKLVAEEEEDE